MELHGKRKWNSTASKVEYDRLIAELLANGRCLQRDADATVVVFCPFGERLQNLRRTKDDLDVALAAIKSLNVAKLRLGPFEAELLSDAQRAR